MKIAQKDLKVLLIILGVVIVVVAYLYGYNPLEEKNKVIIQEITGLRTELTELQILAEKEEFYISSIEKMEQEAQEIFSQFPADVKTEDCIMYAQELETNTLSGIESITFASNVLAYSWGKGAVNEQGVVVPTSTTDSTATEGEEVETQDGAVVEEAVVEEVTAENNKELFVTNIALDYKSTYKELKELIQYIHNNENRRTLQTMNVSYNSETGNLTGSLEMGMYSLTGLNKAYQEPAIPSMTLGTDNIFGTVEVPTTVEENSEADPEN